MEKKIVRVYVQFNFGSFSYVGVTIHPEKSFAENVKARSADIERYYDDDNKTWVKVI